MTITKRNVFKERKQIARTAEAVGCSHAEAACILFVGTGQESGIPFYGRRDLWRAQS